MNTLGLTAGATVHTTRFVRRSATLDFTGIEAVDASVPIIGVSAQESRRTDTPTEAAEAGEPLPMYGPGEIGWVYNSANAVAITDIVTATTAGAAIPVGSANSVQYVGGIPLQAAPATAGAIFRIIVWPYTVRNAVA